MFKVINNFLSNKNYKVINEAMNEEYFPWYYNKYKIDGDKELFHYQMTHVFYKDGQINSNYFSILEPLFKKIKLKTLIKVKANLNPISQTLVEFREHEDTPKSPENKSMIYYINSNNGYTKIKNKKIKSTANKALFFSSDTVHNGTNSTDCNNRMVINIIYVV